MDQILFEHLYLLIKPYILASHYNRLEAIPMNATMYNLIGRKKEERKEERKKERKKEKGVTNLHQFFFIIGSHGTL